ncbi:autotransporter outer membrane beta-barrel domain-containing protein [Opitutus sp. GAS368]|uniref:autotransporter family protein n=1 Tax=Opitutus sp. GAS368 TaxID=1882749 RepID=UPI00087CFDCB|nr:autotransporter outer membrane beta-barrel domain-containing protein [Opitutus sp. GAS368]SDS25125.1 Uncharacterized conserved protein, contains a C-terminal beta-barrel porin domain [Opitutus sp. GAS368]
MTATLRLLSLAALCGWLLSPAHAQTAVWIGQGNLATFGDNWIIAANWDTGVVPDGPAAIAVINQATPAVRNFPDGPYVNASGLPVASVPGGALAVVTGPITLDTLRFDLNRPDFPPYTAAVYVGNPGSGATGSLRLEGAGWDIRIPAAGGILPQLNVTPGSSLTFANRASVSQTGVNGPDIYFSDSSATPANPARLVVQDDAVLASTGTRASRVLSRGATDIVFQDRARAGNTVFVLGAQTTVGFHNTASAGSAQFNLGADNLLLFDGDSSAGSSNIYFNGSGNAPNSAIVRFAGRSTAGQSLIIGVNGTGAVEFADQATGGSVSIGARRIDITGAATETGSTGRLRATTSTLAPVTVVANDTRTVSVGTVSVQDVLLGSNTLEVTGGFISNIRDTGGAYLSAAGENLAGGGLLKTGAGGLTLLAPYGDPTNGFQPSFNVFSGQTIVRGGTLYLYNRLGSVTVETGGSLYGSGLVVGRLLNQGRVSSAASVIGDFVQVAGAVYQLDSYAISFSPIIYGLSVTGNASLAGRLAIAVHPNLFAGWQPGIFDATILRAGSITGRFDTFDTSGNPARIRATASYGPTTVQVRLEMLPFAALAVTPAGTAFGAYLDRVFVPLSFFPNNYNWTGSALTFATDPVKVAQTMTDLSPDRYGVVFDQAVAAAQARRSALDRVTGGNQALPAGTPGRFFAEGAQRRLDFAAIDGLPAAHSSTNGWLAGGAGRWGDWTAGGYLAAEHSDLEDEAGTAAKIRNDELGFFARFDHGPWFVHAGAGRVASRHDLRRFVHFTATSAVDVTHTAAANGDRTDFSLTAGRTWRGRAGSLSPFVGFLASRWRMDDFTETTNRTFPYDSLAIKGWAQNSRRARAGFEAAGRTLGGRLQPRLTVAWWHEFAEDRSIPTSLVGAPAGYLAPGRPAETDFVQANLELDYHLGRGSILYFSGGGGRGSKTSLISDFSAGFQWSL